MKYFLISDNVDTSVGMRLAGITGVVVHTAQEVRQQLEKACADEEIGVVLMTHKLIKLCPDLVYDIKLNYKRPLIVEVADRHGEGQLSDSLTRYVRESIGIKI
ncbi:V-type ATP synthase subunit F [Youxingia wuxianensis]|uniref:V-type ATP synthase subunit F n=1 Tax=Youxingia wuxianensis TaxID=2763678 RepID=A0A926IBH2_9FIRM|nr:V-type ATP synthase subunit F [Youxingia wuxianensis]MBC8584097.1 V-type ATP synthase subunit F [Youxingia wuxianensis]